MSIDVQRLKYGLCCRRCKRSRTIVKGLEITRLLDQRERLAVSVTYFAEDRDGMLGITEDLVRCPVLCTTSGASEQ